MTHKRDLTPIIYIAIMILVFMLGTSIEAKGQTLKKTFKFATFYTAFSGGNSIADDNIYSVTNGLETQTIKTPFDYSLLFGARKIKRFGYEPKEAFKNGTANSYSDAATVGLWTNKVEFLFQHENCQH